MPYSLPVFKKIFYTFSVVRSKASLILAFYQCNRLLSLEQIPFLSRRSCKKYATSFPGSSPTRLPERESSLGREAGKQTLMNWPRHRPRVVPIFPQGQQSERNAREREKNPKRERRDAAVRKKFHFCLSPPRLAFLAWGDFHALSRFACTTFPEEKQGLIVVQLRQVPGKVYYLSDTTRTFHANGKISESDDNLVMVKIIIMMMITVTVCYKARMIIIGESILITTNDFEFEFYLDDFLL